VNDTPLDPPAEIWLARFAKLVVAAAFFLILTGAHTTTAGAGMAFPDWPLSNGSLNPEGWLTDFIKFLEHNHRLTAGVVAALVTLLFVWVWRVRSEVPRAAFGLALAAVVGVFAQALLGGLRVVLDPQGIAASSAAVATTFRVLHGCFAQIELCLLVALAAILSPVWPRLSSQPAFRKIARLGWITAALVFCQLIVGATMRHLGAGLAIPTFPLTPDGRVMPAIHNAFVDLNFTHTRVGALVVTIFVAWLTTRTRRAAASEPRLTRPAWLLDGLLVAQLTLGMSVIWHLRPPGLTTLHVVNGAALLATTVLLAVRAGRASAPMAPHSVREKLVEVAV
jgi:cytochrome c oxidase assembly protein subunit 15